ARSLGSKSHLPGVPASLKRGRISAVADPAFGVSAVRDAVPGLQRERREGGAGPPHGQIPLFAVLMLGSCGVFTPWARSGMEVTRLVRGGRVAGRVRSIIGCTAHERRTARRGFRVLLASRSGGSLS